MLFFMGLLSLISAISCQTSDNTTLVGPHIHRALWNSTFTDKLRKNLLTNYDRFSRPTHHEKATDLNVTLYVHHIDIDEQQSIMILNGRIHFSWTDDKLKWRPARYGGLDSVHMADYEMWQPDIILYNSAVGNDILHYGKTLCIAYSAGKVLWVPPLQFQVFCDLDFKNWPFDVQKCMVKIGSWTYSADMINLRAEKPVIETIMENPEWEILDVITTRNVKFYECCPEPYADIEYNITIRRRSELYKTLAFTPITIVTLTTLASFWLPPEAGEKVVLNSINAVILTIFIKYFSKLLPVSATHIPLIVCHYIVTLYLVCIALVLGVIVIKISRNQSKKGKVPECYKTIIDSWYGSWLGLTNPCAGQKSSQELKDVHSDGNPTSDDSHQLSPAENELYWSLLGALIDRTAFWVYLIIFVLMILKIFL